MPALPSILQTRDNSYRYLGELLQRLAKAAAEIAWEVDYQNRTGQHGDIEPKWRYLNECLHDVVMEKIYLRDVIKEIKRQEEGGDVGPQAEESR